MTALATAVLESPSLRAQYAERITAAWHKSREKIFALGNALIEARQRLSAPEFNAMVEEDLPFGYDHARRFMRIAGDKRLMDFASKQTGDMAIEAMDELGKLNDQQFEAVVASGRLDGPLPTVKETRELVKQYLAPAPYDITLRGHRPEAVRMCEPPAQPHGSAATTWSELVWLLIQRRKEIGLSHLAFDDRIGWSQGQTSKYEIPHADDGRIPNTEQLRQWLQGLKVGLAIVPMS